MAQETKKLIDVGMIGNQSTGDILYDGGVKLNSVINALYSTFGDQRLEAVDNGINRQILHAAGYYQKLPRQSYTQPVELGSMHDIDVSAGSLVVRLPKAKLGEKVVLVNSNGSISNSLNLVITPNVLDVIGTSTGSLTIKTKFTRVELVCTNEEGSKGTWSYKTESMFGDYTKVIEGTYNIKNTKSNIAICHKDDYDLVKLMLMAKTDTDFRSSEVLFQIANNEIKHTEYAVLKTKDLFNIDFTINQQDIIELIIDPNETFRLSIKSIESMKAGVAI